MPATALRLELSNFRSFAAADVTVEPLTAFVGPNSAGKSNLVDAFSFVQEAVVDGLSLALERRGGFHSVRYLSGSKGGRPRNVMVRLTIRLPEDDFYPDFDFEPGATATYSFLLGPSHGSYAVIWENLLLSPYAGATELVLSMRRGRVEVQPPGLALADGSPDELRVPLISGHPLVNTTFSFLEGIASYEISTGALSDDQPVVSGRRLLRDGSNAASVLRSLGPLERTELVAVLGKAVPGVTNVRTISRGRRRAIVFDQVVADKTPVRFEANQMSEGTLRLLGMLLVLFQPDRPTLITIEEPETALHFDAGRALLETFAEHSFQTQIIFTTHSPELLDAIGVDKIRVIRSEDGESIVAHVASHSQTLVETRQTTPGTLLRQRALHATGENLA